MKIRYLLFALLMFSVAGGNLNAQGLSDADLSDPLNPVSKPSTVYFGLTVGYNKVMHNAEIKTFAQDVLCPAFEDGKANGFHAGGFYEQFIGEVGTAHSIVLRGLYNTFPTSFDKQGDKSLSRVVDPTKEPTDPDYLKEVYSTIAHKNEIKYTAISAELMYKFRAYVIDEIGALVFTVGPSFDFIGTKTRNQSVSIVDPIYVQFWEDPTLPAGQKYSADKRSIIVYEGDIENAQSLRFAIKAGVQLEIKLPGTPIDIIPGAFYNFAFTDVDERDWKVNAIQIGVDLRYGLKLF